MWTGRNRYVADVNKKKKIWNPLFHVWSRGFLWCAVASLGALGKFSGISTSGFI